MSAVTTRVPGLSAARYLRSLAIADGSPAGAAAYAASQKWVDAASVAIALKTAVPAMDRVDGLSLVPPGVGTDFSEALRPASVVSRLPLSRVPLNTRLVWGTSGATGYWPSEGSAVPASSAAFDGDTLTPMRVSALVVSTMELLRNSRPSAEQTFLRDLVRATAQAIDRAFVDPSNAGGSGKPASVTFGAPTYPANGTNLTAVDQGLGLLLGGLSDAGSTLENVAFIMRPRTAISLAGLRAGDARAFPGVGLNGGTIYGIPVFVSASLPLAAGSPTSTFIVALDCNEVLLGDEGDTALDLAKSADVEMVDAPSGSSTTPTATQLVSMFQTNSVAMKASRLLNWTARRSGMVQVLSGVAY